MDCYRMMYAVLILASYIMMGDVVESSSSGNWSTASFYGNSYILIPSEDASTQTNLKIQFNTRQADGLILYAAGRKDHILIELVAGAIHVEMDLGLGPTTIVSQQGVLFNDNMWHYLFIQRVNSEVILTIDGKYTTPHRLKGRYFELNILHGIFLGGRRSSATGNENRKNFRGCMRYAMYNSLDLFYNARQQQNPLNVHHVTWGCSTEFSATSDQPVSFLSDESFVAFPSMEMPEGGQFFFEIKTRVEQGIVVYNSGKGGERDYMALELIDGKLLLSVDKGQGTEQLMSDSVVNDSIWHRVTVTIRDQSMEIIVDGLNKEIRSDFDGAEFLDLGGHLYMGGLNQKGRMHAIRNRLTSVRGSSKGSIKGCIRNLRYNRYPQVGLPHVQISQDVQPNCLWKYPCISNPCISGAVCIENGYDSYDCHCDKDMCFRPVGTAKPSAENVIRTQPLFVNEGARALIAASNINFLFKYWLYSIEESAIVFRIITRPSSGIVEVDVPTRQDPNVFTLSDLNANKVHFSHDGSEILSDSFRFTVEILGHPDIFDEKPSFTLPIAIMEINDKPVIELIKDSTLTVILYTKTTITPDIINVFDGDDNPANLKFLITYEGGIDGGFFAKKMRSGRSITSFTQKEIIQHKIFYTNHGATRQRFQLRAEDGRSSSEEKMLTIIATNIEVKMTNNTGLRYEPGAPMVLTNYNLSFTTNVPDRNIELNYHVSVAPRYGEVQILNSRDVWERADTFKQKHLNNRQIRYVQTDVFTHPKLDEIRFNVRAMSTNSAEYTFRIKYNHGGIRVLRNNKLQMNGVVEVKITNINIEARTVDNAHPQDIIYKIIQRPRYGFLYLVENDTIRISHEKYLRENSQFTQLDINGKKIVYRLTKVSNYAFDDQMQFKIHGPNSVESDVLTFQITYEPNHKNTTFINNGLRDVLEGRRRRLSYEDLYVETTDGQNYQFTLVTLPKHGVIEKLDPSTEQILKANSTTFTNRDIRDGSIFYHHDNSESEHDWFNFMATPILVSALSSQQIQEFSDTFQIKILLRNDNPPVRVVDRVFQVVTNQGRSLTGKDLKFKDPDLDFDDNRLQYNIRQISNGRIVLAKNHSARINHFTQGDLELEKLYFIHTGEAYSRTEVSVTDGHFYTQALFEVQASRPFISLVNNTGIMVERGKYATLTPLNISIDTNLDTNDDEIMFIISKAPADGRVVKDLEAVTQFTMSDIKRGDVQYRHYTQGKMRDSFDYYIRIGRVEVAETIQINVFTENLIHPPVIEHNKVLVVREGDSAIINSRILKVTHKDTDPANIIYTITSLPVYGDIYFEREGQSSSRGYVQRISTFTQEDINKNLLTYAQKVPDQTSDLFTFDVTNGIKVLIGIDFVFEIMPKTIILKVQNLTVPEGGTLLMNSAVIRVEDNLFVDDLITYAIIKPPLHGWIENNKFPIENIARFTSKQLAELDIQYTHDNNETLTDHFTVIAMSRSQQKQSYPYTVYISVQPVNDEYPEVINNNPLKVWKNSSSVITRDYLLALDKDSAPNELKFEVVPESLRGGHVSKRYQERTRITSFTQTNIDDARIVFVHDGTEKRGGFQFHVTDGINPSSRHRFVVVARQLRLVPKTREHLDVFPLTRQTITRNHLFTKTNDQNQTRRITYMLQSKPKFGGIERKHIPVEKFTQGDINAGLIQYKHTSSSMSGVMQDSFMFDIATEYADTIKFEQFDVHISYESLSGENQVQLVGMSKLVVLEGGNATLKRDNLNITKLLIQLRDSGIMNPYVCYVVKEAPRRGWLMFDGHNATNGTIFLQDDINVGRLKYIHDHSDTRNDSFQYFVHVGFIGSSEEPNLAKDKMDKHDSTAFPIEILAVNDQPLQLVTITPLLKLIQDQTKLITRDILEAKDADSPPEEISYVILNGPDVGQIMYSDNPNKEIRRFTQKDINDNRVIFVHNGVNYRPKGSFYFRVSVNEVNPIFKMFEVRVEILKMAVRTNDLYLKQSESAVLITSDNVHTVTNDKRDNIRFNVTNLPKFGKLFINDHPVHHFTQLDVDKNSVMYVQTDLTVSSDSFVLTVYNKRFSVQNKHINITVRPLLNYRPFNASYGRSQPITYASLDASELAKITGSNPTYELLKLPYLGRIVRTTKRQVRDVETENEKSIKSFTHHDIVNSVIYYEAKPFFDASPKRDQFTFVVNAEFAQPAIGTFVIDVSPPVDEPITVAVTTPEPSPSPASTSNAATGGKAIKGSGLGHDQLLIIFLVVGLVLIIAVILILVKCIHKPKQRSVQDVKQPAQVGFDQPHSIDSSHMGTLPLTPPPGYTSSSRDIPVIRVTHDAPPSLSSDTLSYSMNPHRSRSPSEVTNYGDTIRKAPIVVPRVTQLYDHEETQVKTPIGHGSLRSNRSPSADQGSFEWDSCDPDLLQHVRTTNPVLKDSLKGGLRSTSNATQLGGTGSNSSPLALMSSLKQLCRNSGN